jgi:hypothetical protein
MSPATINLITNIIAFLLAVLEPVRAYLTSQPFNWQTFILCILGAIVSYFTGKGSLSILKMMKVPPNKIGR